MSPDRLISGLTLAIWVTTAQAAVDVVRVEARDLHRSVQVSGEFTPWQTVNIHARVSGFIEKMLVDRGTAVKQGQLLAVVSAPEMEAQIAEGKAKAGAAQAQVAEANARSVSSEAVLKRLREAAATPGAISRTEIETAEQTAAANSKQVEAARAALEAANAAVEALQKMSSYLQIAAPFSGFVTERLAHPGALASPVGDPLLRIEQVSRLRLVVAVPESAYARIAAGARVPFRVAAYPGETFHGRVARNSRKIDPKTRTAAIELDVPNENGRFAPGMYAEVDWPVSSQDALMVPATSVATTTERVFVIRVRNGRAEWVNVQRGVREGDLIQVRGDLRPGDLVLRRGSDEIHDGARL